jgi:hypothetical protein
MLVFEDFRMHVENQLLWGIVKGYEDVAALSLSQGQVLEDDNAPTLEPDHNSPTK